MKSLARTLALALLVCGLFASNASAYWSNSGLGNGSGTTATMPTGATPTVSVAGTTVTVSFSQVNIVALPIGSLGGGGYEVRRYPANGGAAVTPGGSCGSLVTGGGATLSCTETTTPRGDWRYTVRPILHGWTGGVSATSAVALVTPDAPTFPAATLAPAADINVGWTAGAGATGYNIYRRTPPAAFNYATPLNGATPLGATSYADGSPVSGTSYVYVIRSVVIGSAGQQIESASSAETTLVTADGVAPTAVSITNPGSPLSGTVTLNGAATDALSGVASVAFQYKTSAGALWTTACTDLATPFNCSFNTTSVADGSYDFRVIATDNAGNSTTSAAVTARIVDNTGPTGVTITAPPAIVTGTITINAGTPTDAGSGVQSVAIQRSPAGAGSWTTICTDPTPAYSCSFNSTAVADGLYDFRALATDNVGNTTASAASTNRRVDNTVPTIVPINPGTWVSGVITLGGTASDGAGSGVTSIVLEGREIGGAWVTLATGTNSVSITYDTAGLADGDYEVRLIATDAAGFSSTSLVSPINVDNTAPNTATVTDPGANLGGTVTVNATAADAFSGVASVQIQRRSPAGTGPWTTICTDTVAPWSCAWDTTLVAEGFHDLRAIVTDNAGNSTTSATVTNRRVDNTAPATATLGAIASPQRATLNMTGTATDAASGIADVQFQRSPAGAGTWTTICTDGATPFTCAFNTTLVADGFYDFRALATDNAGNNTASTLQTNIRIDNTVPTAADIQTVNSGIAGRPTTGDQVIYTFSEAMQPATILTGFTGASINVTVRLNNVGGGDQLLVYNAANTTATNLGTMRTGNAGYVTVNRTFTATMVMTGNTIIVTLGTPSGATNTVAANATLSWTPLATMLDLAGNAMSTTPRNETGAADWNF